MATSDAQKRATNKWQKENYEFIKIRLNKGQTDLIREKAKESGKSMNQYIVDKIFGNDVNIVNNGTMNMNF